MKYYLGDKNGYYLRRDAAGNFVPVKNILLADWWEQSSKAANILGSCVNKNLRSRYKVKAVEESISQNSIIKTSVKPKEEFTRSIAKELIEEGETDKWVNGIEVMKNFIEDSEGRKDELTEALSEVDKEISDINHYIEFGKFNAYQGYLAFDMLKQRLMKRRKIKNELTVLFQLGECKITSDKLENIQRAISELDNRKYQPRVLIDLFE